MDDKEIVTAGLMVMLLLAAHHVKLNRDVIFVAEAGEEGTPAVGIDFLVNRHWDEIAAEYALAEGGSAVAQGGNVRYVAITTAEKVPRGVRLIARGPSGPRFAALARTTRCCAWRPPSPNWATGARPCG